MPCTLSQLNNTGTSPLLAPVRSGPPPTTLIKLRPLLRFYWVLLDDQHHYVVGSSGVVAVAMPDGIYPGWDRLPGYYLRHDFSHGN